VDWQRTGQPPEESDDWALATPLTRELVLTCLRHKGCLDAWIHKLSSRPPAAEFRPVLWLGLAQLFLLDGIAEHAALHETLEAAKAARFPKALIGFANGLLRNAQRQKESLLAWMESQPLQARRSHPELLVNRWISFWGEEKAGAVCAWNQDRARTFARLRFEVDPLPADLEPLSAHPGFHRLPRGLDPVRLTGFAEGAWYIQDPSTALAPALLAARPGERILDACAAPGGKSALIADALGDGGRGLMAIDPQPRRVERLRENLARLRLPSVETACANLEELDAGDFDAVLLDVPCSNTGVLQRRPDARWRFTRAALRDICAVQRSLLDQAAPRVKPGGRLVYSTCSIEPEETTAQVAAWLQDHPGWTLEEEKLLFPGEQHCDGAYAARLRKCCD